MAKLVQHSNGRWYLHFADRRSGRSREVSTYTDDKNLAKQRLADFEAEYRKPPRQAQPTINDILDYYLKDREGRVSGHNQLVTASKPLREHLGHIQPKSFTKDNSRDYIAKRTAMNRKPGTIIKELTTLRSALSLAKRDRILSEVPHIEMPPAPPAKERWLTRDEATKLIAAAETDHMKLFLLLALYTGARKTAILQLTWDRVSDDNKIINYRLPGRPETKKRRGIVPTTQKLQEALSAARKRAKTNYVIEYRGGPVLNVKHAWKLTLDRSGIAHCTPHDLRHTCATWMKRKGVKSARVAAMLATTEKMIEKVYGHHDPSYLQDALDALED